MGVFSRLGRALIAMDPPAAPRRAGRSRFPRAASRNYTAGSIDRLKGDWTTTNKTADAILRTQLRALRARSRDLCRNNDYARRFLKLLEQNVIGFGKGGIRYQARTLDASGQADLGDNDRLEEGFADWGALGVCTLDGRLTWRDAQALIVRSIAQDGEILIRRVKGRQAGNRFGYALQLIEADHLDETYRKDLGGGRHIEMGVEFNEYNRPVAYHVLTRHPGEDVYYHGRQKYKRIPAEQILHPFQFDRITQARGVPWLFSAMTRLHMLGGYEEAELVAARVAASQMGLIMTETGDEEFADGEDALGNLELDAEPGTFRQVPGGTDFKMFDPKHPVDAFPAFCKAMLRGAAAGVGVSYYALSQDLEGVNYSSLRQGALDERDAYRTLQTWLIGQVIDPVFVDWLDMSLLTGELGLPASRRQKFLRREWQPRGWQWVDPLKEVRAAIEAINAGLRSRGDVMADQGRDPGDVFAALAAEGALAAENGLIFTDERGGSDNANPQENDDD